MNCPNWLQSAALAKPDGVAFTFCSVAPGSTDESWTYRQLLRRVQKAAGALAANLAESRCSPSESVRIGLFGPASPEWLVILHALGWLGWEAVLLPARAPPPELLDAVGQAPSMAAVYVTAQAAPEGRAALARSVSVWGWPHPPLGPLLAPSVADELSEFSGPSERHWPLEEIRVWMRSSGTTATPHFVPLTTAQIYFAAVGSAERLGHLTGDIWLNSLPLEHVGGVSIVYRATLFAVCVRFLHPFCPRRVATKLIDDDIALISLVPQMLQRVLDVWPTGARPNPRLRALLVGGGPSDPALLFRAHAFGLPAVATWGMTETGAQVATVRPGDAPNSDKVGAPLIHARVRKQDAVADVGVLEVWTAGMDEPMTTRDLGEVDPRGIVYVRGRVDDLIISGGMKILPREVEVALESHPGVLEACVVGRPDAKWGMRPLAFLVPRPNTTSPSDETLATYCCKLLARYKAPTQFLWRKELPRDQLGKLRRRSVK